TTSESRPYGDGMYGYSSCNSTMLPITHHLVRHRAQPGFSAVPLVNSLPVTRASTGAMGNRTRWCIGLYRLFLNWRHYQRCLQSLKKQGAQSEHTKRPTSLYREAGPLLVVLQIPLSYFFFFDFLGFTILMPFFETETAFLPTLAKMPMDITSFLCIYCMQ